MVMRFMACFLMVAVLSGCAGFYGGKHGSGTSPMRVVGGGNMAEVQPDRMLIWKASLGVQVWSISNAVAEATALAERQNGFIEQKSDQGDGSASLTLRIPAETFMTALSGLEALGTMTYRHITGEDVTEQFIDVQARLKNKIVLRDRLKELLDKATEIADILAIETELNRVQADIDSMEGRIKAMEGQVEYATVRLSLSRKPILGPLGYVFKGLWWGVTKLFVIRE